MSAESLWGDLPVDAGIKLPVTILQEQASILSKSTGRILEGKVRPFNTGVSGTVGYSLTILAPALGNFEFQPIDVTHSAVVVYPLIFKVRFPNRVTTQSSCGNEEQFIEKLSAALSSQDMHDAIASLIAQSKATKTT